MPDINLIGNDVDVSGVDIAIGSGGHVAAIIEIIRRAIDALVGSEALSEVGGAGDAGAPDRRIETVGALSGNNTTRSGILLAGTARFEMNTTAGFVLEAVIAGSPQRIGQSEPGVTLPP
jgi:hypothetical protein